MKRAKLNDYLFWRGELAQIVGESEGRQVIIQPLEDRKCPNCGHNLGKEQIHVIESSPMFQEGAERIETIEG